MPPLVVHWTHTYPNPRRDINPSTRILVVNYTAPDGHNRFSIFGENEDWRRLLPLMVDRNMKLQRTIPTTLTVN